eukprot:3104544-Prymnesium_polylepis.1
MSVSDHPACVSSLCGACDGSATERSKQSSKPTVVAVGNDCAAAVRSRSPHRSTPKRGRGMCHTVEKAHAHERTQQCAAPTASRSPAARSREALSKGSGAFLCFFRMVALSEESNLT